MFLADVIDNALGNSFQEIDEHIKCQYKTISCDELFQAYMKFCECLKNRLGSDEHFSGFSESLLFRVMYHKIATERGITFEKVPYKNAPERFRKAVFSAHKIDLELAQNRHIPLPAIGKRAFCVPDISLCVSGELIGALEVKTYPAFGQMTIAKLFDDYSKKVRRQFARAAVLLIIYHKPPVAVREPVLITKLTEYTATSKGWFSYIFLEGSEEPFDAVLNNFLCKINI